MRQAMSTVDSPVAASAGWREIIVNAPGGRMIQRTSACISRDSRGASCTELARTLSKIAWILVNSTLKAEYPEERSRYNGGDLGAKLA
jgi:hypothetical protein